MKKFLLVPAVAILALAQNVFAANGYVTVGIETISIVGNVANSNHKPGNMELKIKDGFSLPTGVSCDKTYITTLQKFDADRAMLSLLRDAYNSGRTVTLWIADDPSYTAYPSRCSILGVTR